MIYYPTFIQRIFFIFLFLVLFSFQAFAQTAPGGIGDPVGSDGEPTLKLWLLPDSLNLSDGEDVLTWNDYSGNGNDLAAESFYSPVFRSDAVNSHDYLEFSKNANRIVRNPFVMPADAVTVFMVLRTGSSGDDALISYEKSGSPNNYLLYIPQSLRTRIENNENNSGVSVNDGNWRIFTHQWRSSDGRLMIHVDGSQEQSTTHQVGVHLAENASLAVGGEQDGADSGYNESQDYDGDIAELIMYGSSLKQTERTVIENYLAQKYGLDANLAVDYYQPADPSYIAALTGMGRESDGITDASCQGLFITQNGGFENGEYIFTAHDGTDNSINSSPNTLHTEVEATWQRDWYLDKSGTVNANLAFDMSEGINGDFPANIYNYRLMYRSSASDPYDTLEVAAKGVQNGDQIYFSVDNNELADGYYTLGTVDQANSPLDGVEGRTWYTLISGEWNNPEVWTLDPSGALPNNPNGYTPSTSPTSNADQVVILSGKTVTVSSGSKTNSRLTVEGRLDLQSTSGHSFGEIRGNGRILLSNDNFPSGDASHFYTPGQGEGTVEYYGTGFDLERSLEFYNLEINMDISETLTLLNDYTIHGNMTIEQGRFRINDNTSTTNLNIEVKGDVLVRNGGSIFTGPVNARHQLNLYGDLTNRGTIEFTNRTSPAYGSEAGNGIVDVNFLSDHGDQSLLCDGPTIFYRIEIDKGNDDTYSLSLGATDPSYFNLYGYAGQDHGSTAQLSDNANALGLIRGTIKVGSQVNIPVLSTSGNYNISESARLWVDGGYVAKNDGNSLVPYGKIRVSDGTLEAEVSSGITTRENGLVKIEGGTLRTNQIRTSVLGASNVGGYVQSGGTTHILGESTNTDYYCFNLTYPGNVFSMSGGTLHVHESHGRGGIFIASEGANQNVTGGTVIMEIDDGEDFPVTSKAPFYNVVIRNTAGGTGRHILTGGTDVGATNEDLPAQALEVFNDLTIETDGTLKTNLNDVYIGRDLYIDQNALYNCFEDRGGDLSYLNGNTTHFNGTEDATLTIGDPTSLINPNFDGDNDPNPLYNEPNAYAAWVYPFYNMTIDKPDNKTLTFAIAEDDYTYYDNTTGVYTDGSGGKNIASWMNWLIKVVNDVTLEGGRVDFGDYAMYAYGSITNNGTMGIDAVPENAEFRTRKDENATVERRIIQTEEGAEFGNFSLHTDEDIIEFTSNVEINRLEFNSGRFDLKEHNLKVDDLVLSMSSNDADFNDCNGCNSPADMIISDGKASDGGLSLYIDGNETYTFPVGNGTDATDAAYNNSKYTPAEVSVSNFNDDGYITIIPVDHAQWSMIGDTTDVLQHYWSVDYEGFSSLPDVQMDFHYHDLSESVDVDGNENNYVPGRLVNLNQWEIDNAGSIDRNNDIIQFSNGTLTRGDYTAGRNNRLNGTVRTLYARKNGEWHDPETWSTVRDGSDPLKNRNQLPEVGDICVIGTESQNYSVAVSSTHDDYEPIEIARLCILRYASGESSLVTVGQNGGDCDFGVVTNHDPDAADPSSTENHSSKIIISGPELPDGDFGQFMNAPNTLFTFSRAFPGTNAAIDDQDGGSLPTTYYGSYTIGNDYSEYPVLQFEYSGRNGGYIELPATDITVNHDIRFLKDDQRILLNSATNGDLTVKKDIEFNSGNSWQVVFQAMGSERILTVEGNINFDNKPALFTAEDAASSLKHKIRLQGNVVHVNNGSNFDLYHSTGNTAASLEFFGEGNSGLPNMPSTPSFHQIIMNKGIDQADTAFVNTNFTLGADPSGLLTDKPIRLLNGVLVLDNASINQNLSTGGEDFEIPASSALKMDQGQVNINGGTGLLLDGTLAVHGGTVDMSGGDHYIQYSASGTATLEITEGILRVGSQIRRGLTSTEGILHYDQSGGAVVAGYDAAPEGNRGVLEVVNDGSSFSHTGGDLYIARSQSNRSRASLFLDPAAVHQGEDTRIHLGHTVTPANQIIGIHSTVALPNLVVDNSSGQAPKALQTTMPLTVTDSLEIDAGASYDANGLELTLEGDLIATGNFIASGNTTFFSGSREQQIIGSAEFWNLTKDQSNTLVIRDDMDVLNDLRLISGTFDDDGNTLHAQGDVWMDATHIYGASGDGISFDGDRLQVLRSPSGTAYFGKISINNAGGVDSVAVSVPQGNDIHINHALQMEMGIFDIGKNLLVLEENAEIIESNAFSSNNMIQTNISFTDAGIKKFFPAISTTSYFTYPIGSAGKYTPVDFMIDSKDAGGSVRVKAANEIHPTIVNDDEPCNDITDTTNVLKYHWLLEAQGISNMDAEVSMHYLEEDVQVDNSLTGTSYDVTDYITARLLLGSTQWNKYGPNSFDEDNHRLTFSFIGTDDEGISGDYTAGVEDHNGTCEGAIPDEVPVYVTQDNGEWTDPATWDTYPGGGGTVPAGGPRGAIVIIEHEVTMPRNYIVNYKTTIDSGEVVNGILRLNETFGHRLGIVDGVGTLQVERGDLPAGVYDEFFSATGGTLEYSGTDNYDVLGGISQLNNLRFSGRGERRLANLDVGLYSDLEILGEDHTLQVINEHDRRLEVEGDIHYAGGSFDAGDGPDASVGMTGSTLQRITGSFEGSNAFNRLELNNATGLEMMDSVEIDEAFALNSGMVYLPDTALLTLNSTSSGALSGAGSSRYIQGPLRKRISNGDAYTFEVGDTSRYGKLTLSVTSPETPQYWEVQYYNNNPHAYGYDTSSYVSPLEEISGNEFWRVKGPGGQSHVTIRWDNLSALPAQTDDRPANLRLTEYLSGQWEEAGSNVTDNGPTDGTIQTDNPVDLEEHVFTLGTREATPQATATFLTEDTTVCDGEPIELTVELTGDPDPDWTLEVDENGTTETYTPSSSPFTFQVTSSADGAVHEGNYSIVSVSDANGTGNVYGNDIYVAVSDFPVQYEVGGGGTICSDSSAPIGLTSSQLGVTYELYDGGATPVQTVSGTGDSLTFGYYSTAGTYTVEAVNSNGCRIQMTGSVDITVNQLPNPEPYANQNPVCYENNLSVNLYANDAGGYAYTWSPSGELNDPALANPEYQPGTNPAAEADTTWFTVEVDNNGCVGVDSLQMILYRQPKTGNMYFVPNDFDQN